jgi:hypothetical protein
MRKLESLLRVRRRRRQNQSISTKTTKPTTLPPIAPATIMAVDVCAGRDEGDADDVVVGVESPDDGARLVAFEDVGL